MYNKKHKTWFKKADSNGMQQIPSPNEKITGTYLYFDYEESWQVKERQNFELDYAFIENELTVMPPFVETHSASSSSLTTGGFFLKYVGST